MGEGHPVPGERLDTAACLDSTHRGDRTAGCPALSSEAARGTVRWTQAAHGNRFCLQGPANIIVARVECRPVHEPTQSHIVVSPISRNAAVRCLETGRRSRESFRKHLRHRSKDADQLLVRDARRRAFLPLRSL